MRITTKLEYKGSRGTKHRIPTNQPGRLTKLMRKDVERAAVKQVLRRGPKR